MSRIVIAFGGNALVERGMPTTAENQLKVAKKTCEHVTEIISRGHEVAIAHGNGPQVGSIVQVYENSPIPMPFDVCGAMSQGYIGYHIQQALSENLTKRGINKPVCSLVTQVVVDKDDPAFSDPVKPIGSFHTEEEAKDMAKEGYMMKEDAGRGWRRVVPSPMPVRIVELETVKQLLGKTIVITVGGGGIPVIEREDGTLEGIAAVIDKDLASNRLAQDLNADMLLILTEVDRVSLNFGKPDQEDLERMSIEDALRYIDEGHFAPGSMLPKVKAAVDFASSHPGRSAVITSLDKAVEALEGEAGTLITG